MKRSAIVTLVVLSVFSVAAAIYMSTSVLDLAAVKQVHKVTVLMNTSGGLMPTSQATMRGIKIGQVSDIQATNTGLAVSVNLDDGVAVPANSRISVRNLSAAGEQYLEFTPTSQEPPYLTDGTVIPASQVAPSYTVSEILAKGNALMSALDANNVHTILKNLGAGIVDNAGTLDRLAVATGLINQMVQDDKRYLTALVNNASNITAGLGAVDAGTKLREAATVLPNTMARFNKMIDALRQLADIGADEVTEGSSLPNLIDKIVDYANDFSGPARNFFTVLAPITAPLRQLKVNAGHWLDFWDSTFDNSGGMRVHMAVPEWPQPGPVPPTPTTLNNSLLIPPSGRPTP